MTTPIPSLYGIPNCDTVKKARTWLTDHGLSHTFHDFKKHGVPTDLLQLWLAAVGWQTLVNRKGTSWRKLDEVTRDTVRDAASATALLLTHPSVIKRPVVMWSPDCVTVGFDPVVFAQKVANL